MQKALRLALISGLIITLSISCGPPSEIRKPQSEIPVTPQPKIKNQKSRVEEMSLEQKIGQIMMIGFDGTTLTPELRRMVEETHVGGVILYERNADSPQQVAQLVSDLQQAARQSGHPGLFVSIDQEGGSVARLKEGKGFTEFPSAMAVAATGDVQNARLLAQAMAAELLALGINMDLAPVLDVNNNPANPVIGIRSFGSNPQQVAAYGVAFIQAMQAAGVMAVGKHFPGHGDTGVDSHVALPTVPHDRARLEAVEFVPFRAAMKAEVAGIMSAHITFPAIDPTPGLAATLSPKVMTALIRQEMGYDGLLLTDSLIMGALSQSGYPAPQAAAAALKAGADLLLFNSGYEQHRQAHAMIVERVQRGEIPEARLDEAVRRVLTAKERFGLLDALSVEVNAAAGSVGTAQNKALSRSIAAQAITLLRDEAKLLPLPANANLLVVETATAPGLGKALGITTIQVGAQPKSAEISTVLDLAKKGGRTVIVATADVAKNPQQADLVKALLDAQVPTLVIALRSPYDLMYLKGAVPTYLVSYGSSPPALEAVTAVLTGKAKAQGRLPVELPGWYKLGDGS